MPTELKILAYGAVLLLVHIFAATHFKNRQYGLKWNVGARDQSLPPLEGVGGRLVRAQANFEETLPIAIIALIGVVVAGRANAMTALGGWIWLGARVLYIPLYAAGVPVVRTLAWGISLAGLVMVIWPLLLG